VEEALRVIERVRPRRAFLTHMCHDILHADLESRLQKEPYRVPVPVGPAHDGLTIPLSDLT
jgi:phosphoribosyl 1,2-cyclic phosphate phosphodiesterase